MPVDAQSAGTGLYEQARRFFARLNGLPQAARYLQMFNREIEFRLDTEPCFTVVVQDGQIGVLPDAAHRRGEFMIMRSDADTLSGILGAHLRYSECGGGYAGRLRCVEGIGFYPDLGWVGILIRLAQENR